MSCRTDFSDTLTLIDSIVHRIRLVQLTACPTCLLRLIWMVLEMGGRLL